MTHFFSYRLMGISILASLLASTTATALTSSYFANQTTPLTLTSSAPNTSNITGATTFASDALIIYAIGLDNTNRAAVTVQDNVSFSNDHRTNPAPAWGGVLFSSFSNLNFGKNISFINNSASSGAGMFTQDSTTSFQDNALFQNNVADINGGAIYSSNNSVFTFGNNASFENNHANRYGGAMFIQSFSDVTFSGDASFTGNSATNTSSELANGGAILLQTNSLLTFQKNVTFTNNDAGTYGGALAVTTNAEARFNGAVLFDGNNADNTAGALYMRDGTITFAPATAGQSVLFQNNTANHTSLSAIQMITSTLNFNLMEGTYADIRDPISGGGTITKDGGNGGLYLWGNNSSFLGTLDVKSGSLYAMFDTTSIWTGRQTFNLNAATVVFSDGTFFRPMMNLTAHTLAFLPATRVTVGTNVLLAPYAISALDTGDYVFNTNYGSHGFQGWDSTLSQMTIGTTANLTIKNDLDGYDGLTAAADVYRKRSDLTYQERQIFDNIYITGLVPQDIKDMFAVISGNDAFNYLQTHRYSLRRYNRQVYARLNNRNDDTDGYPCADYCDKHHLWINVSYNAVDKDSSASGIGYTYHPAGLAVGFDNDWIKDELNVGVAFGYAFGTVKNRVTGMVSENDTDEYMLSFYGKYKPLRAFASWNAGFGYITNATQNLNSFIDTKGDYSTYAGFANTEFGYDFGDGWSTVEPYVGAEYAYLYDRGYNETGSAARHIGGMHTTIFETPVGIRASHDFCTGDVMLTPAVDVAYSHNWGDKNAKTNAYFIGMPNTPWFATSVSDKRDGMRGNLNLKINHNTLPFALNLGYAIDYRSDYTDQQIYATFRYDF